MKPPEISPRWACSYFFAVCGIAYGSVMSRMPALKAQAGLSDADIGIVLLCMGLGGLLSFPLAGWLISRTSCRTVLRTASLLLILAFPCTGLIHGFVQACVLFSLLGFSIGLNDVAINTGSIIVETAMHRPVVSSMHALYSSGGLLGSVAGSCMAWAGIGPLGDFTATALVLLLLLPLFASRLMRDVPKKARRSGRRIGLPPSWLLLTGAVMLCSYSAEGSVGEWGVLLLHDVKGAPEQVAALVYAAFSVSMTIMRFFGDRFRLLLGDALVMKLGSLLALAGMCTGLFAPHPAACLGGYMLMGAGLSVTVPVLFCSAGRHDDVPAGTAAAVLSMVAASGQLFIPPLIGMIGARTGLQDAMCVIVALCAFMLAGSGVVRDRK